MGGIYTRWLVEDTAYTGFQGRKLGQDHRHLVDHLGRLEQILCSIPRAGVFPVNWAGALLLESSSAPRLLFAVAYGLAGFSC